MLLLVREVAGLRAVQVHVLEVQNTKRRQPAENPLIVHARRVAVCDLRIDRELLGQKAVHHLHNEIRIPHDQKREIMDYELIVRD